MEKLTVTVEEMAGIIGGPKPKAYELAHSENFPAVRIGRRIVVPVDELKRWLASQAAGVGQACD